MIPSLEARIRRLRRKIDRTEWFIRFLDLPRVGSEGDEPGVVLIQIDGLGRGVLEEAMAQGRMPFLRRLLEKEGHRLHTLYSGVPATTPAVQGELFYGVKGVVPAFGFRRAGSGERVRMFEPAQASAYEALMQKEGQGLLEGGSSYSNLFTGGAAESHFCASSFGIDEVLRKIHPWKLLAVLVSHGSLVFRTLGLVFLELVLALADLARGLLAGRSLAQEVKFAFLRVALLIWVREFIVASVRMDLGRGLPVIHANFVGYDEQAHHRGPRSAFARWCLKGIDDSVRRIAEAAWRSPRRGYQVVVHSDHGQSQALPYHELHGRTLLEAVAEATEELREELTTRPPERGGESQRGTWIGFRFLTWLADYTEDRSAEDHELVVMGLGPLGHAYLPSRPSGERQRALARALVERAAIPMVLYLTDDGAVEARTSRGAFVLPEDAEQVFGAAHPFLEEVVEDVLSLVQHPDAGHFVLSGWAEGEPTVTFAVEHGSHASFGEDELTAFALLPAPMNPRREVLRPMDLRRLAFRALRTEGSLTPAFRGQPRAGPEGRQVLRVVTYNVHSCIGNDGKHSPARIARVLSSFEPDVVALQELDCDRRRTGGIHQAQEIARLLDMQCHFHPALEVEEEKYGDALLSVFPLRLRRAEALPSLPGRRREPRGALWVEIELPEHRVQVLNTHFGLHPRECRLQAEELAGEVWLAHPDCAPPIIVCGDLNAARPSWVCEGGARRLLDVQASLHGHRPQATWATALPLRRLDHVFVSPDLEVLDVRVPRNRLTRVASDHLPLVVDLALP